ncbi:hypothetical protein BDR05DRAFT_999731 [Suillus weaverae]|nr:hypothetical protein BDR05DRAFT_999731 [Suillus weaverae]
MLVPFTILKKNAIIRAVQSAQLYRSKISDCWIYIWVILDHHPSHHYKKQYVLPGAVIPGPKNPKNFDSFLFPGFHDLMSLQNEGLQIWDVSYNINFTSRPFLTLPTADALGLVHFDGSHYFPVLLKPLNYTVRGCSHNDIDVFNLPATGSESYPVNLVAPAFHVLSLSQVAFLLMALLS